MNKKIIKARGLIIIILLCGLFTGCSSKDKDIIKENKDETSLEQNLQETRKFKDFDDISAWITYWDLGVEKEIIALGDSLDEVCYFGAYFDANNEIILPQSLLDYYKTTKQEDVTNYISFVNDKVITQDTTVVKDKDLLISVLDNEASRNEHIQSVIKVAMDNGFQGIEIDYENFKEDIDLWGKFILFINQLYEETEKLDLDLRVVLEPYAPIEKVEFIKGPTYVMMCYNLHGGFSEPGPKANSKFIKELIHKMEKVPGDKSFAIATGGFDWAESGEVASITQVDAEKLIKEYKEEVTRDTESQCNVFKYTDKEGIDHEVWYADSETLLSWMKVIEESSNDISIWRLGHNSF